MPSETTSQPVDKRYEFVLFFDVQDGNPNGDPDAGNAPRIDPETGQGLVTDVCLKRKVRNFVQLTQTEGDGNEMKPKEGHEIYVKERGILALQQKRAYTELKLQPDGLTTTAKTARAWMCRTFYDVRAFGAVMSTGKAGDEDAETKAGKKEPGAKKNAPSVQKLWNCGQVRGPIQLSFSRSIEPILALEHAITRVALTNAGDTSRGQEVASDGEEASSGQFGRKMTVPYGLYRAQGFVSPFLARDTGFSKADLELLWQALAGMFEHDRSASRGVMAARSLIVFEHASALGDHPAHRLFDLVSCTRREAGSKKPARSFADYKIEVAPSPTNGVTIHERI
ncbi:type I CRISPR-associated protein Cas7 [Paludisphaera mucosa]|uniref:Type I CRISPR-associated protein Cas7 n=1 Tax=Paludisphaera mucosa TaxID=3030827 RepID=A0ABT6F5J3_9BACT|nr:type I CRISPR-associated protein Cas7 [Paludisphaera mucosa]MDG3002829.1 type I CRISPR-associated protein Cas7 [Paludisphaera mucosa]